MNTTENSTTSKNTSNAEPFKRKGRIGMNILEMEQGVQYYLAITKYSLTETRDGREIPTFTCTDLRTGEEQTLWVDGGMKGQFSAIGGVDKAVNKSFEFTKTGQKTINHDELGNIKVNQYSIYELEAD